LARGTHLFLGVVFYGAFYLIVKKFVKKFVKKLLKFFEVTQSKLSNSLCLAVIAFLLYKIIMPIRFWVTAAVVPVFAKWFGKDGD
jgi:large-conductance mechanosensitive channel